VVVGLDARGFLFGPSLALRLGAAFAPVCKAGKLPIEYFRVGYQKEYGEDFFEMQKDAIGPGKRVVIVDDIIATGRHRAAGRVVWGHCRRVLIPHGAGVLAWAGQVGSAGLYVVDGGYPRSSGIELGVRQVYIY
jgi:hypothetical protein